MIYRLKAAIHGLRTDGQELQIVRIPPETMVEVQQLLNDGMVELRFAGQIVTGFLPDIEYHGERIK